MSFVSLKQAMVFGLMATFTGASPMVLKRTDAEEFTLGLGVMTELPSWASPTPAPLPQLATTTNSTGGLDDIFSGNWLTGTWHQCETSDASPFTQDSIDLAMHLAGRGPYCVQTSNSGGTQMDIGKSAAIGIMGPKGHWWRCGDIGGWIMNMARKCSQNGKSGGVVHVDGTNEQAGLHFLLYHSRDGR